MYTAHYNLAEPPFSIAPDPRYLYLTAQHREALAHLLYGIGTGGGFVVLTGEVGTGKTTLSRCLLEQLPDDVDLALIFNPRLDSRELVAAICDELGVAGTSPDASLKQLIDALNRRLLDSHAQGRRTIVLIDEAQNLSFEVLEQIRLLTNLETNQAKLLQIILVGQPELNGLLDSPELRQLAQRITARYHLRPLTRSETADYVRHRLSVAGLRYPLFSGPALARVYRMTGGIPRRINILCDRALLGAYSLGRFQVSRGVVTRAARELRPPRGRRRLYGWAVAAGLTAAALGGLVLWQRLPPPTDRSPGDSPISQEPAPPNSGAEAIAQAPSAPAAVSLPSFGELLSKSGTHREIALARLFEAWKLPPPAAGADACVEAEAQGLRCLLTHGTWLQLQELDLPAVLELLLPAGDKRHATLLSLTDGTAELALDGKVRRFGPADFLPYWRGDALVLWRPPPGSERALAVGARSDAVVWVRERLAAPAPPDRQTLFDPDLRDRVLNFQKQHALVPDGVIGTLTLIRLGQAANDGSTPRLIP